MIEIQNCKANADLLFQMIKREKITPIFDLDEVLFSAQHRQKLYDQADVDQGRCNADQIGQLDLDHYRENTTADQVAQDRDLPLIRCVHLLNAEKIPYHVATARVACQHTRQLLQERGVYPKVFIHREHDQDRRRDDDLKAQGVQRHFVKCLHSRLLMIDDNLANCRALARLGLRVVRVVMPKLNIRELI